jgi:trk system potassium uptake protein TrkA
VLGLGQFGRNLARELTKLGCEVLAIDASPRKVESIRNDVTLAAAGDIRDREVLREICGTSVDLAVIAIGGSLEASILAIIHLKEMGVKEIWAEASTEDRAHALSKVGASRILSPEREMGRRLAQALANPNMIEFLPLSEGYGVIEVEAPSWTHGRSLRELDLRRTMHLAVIAVRAPDGPVEVVPGGETVLDHKHILTLVGRDADMTKFREKR